MVASARPAVAVDVEAGDSLGVTGESALLTDLMLMFRPPQVSRTISLASVALFYDVLSDSGFQRLTHSGSAGFRDANAYPHFDLKR